MSQTPADHTTCPFVWICCEPMVGIICACLPTYAILFRTQRKNANPWAAKSTPQWYHWSRRTSRIRSSRIDERNITEGKVYKLPSTTGDSTRRDALAFGYVDVEGQHEPLHQNGLGSFIPPY